MEVVSNKRCGAVVGDVMEVVSMIWGSRCTRVGAMEVVSVVMWGSRCGSHKGSECVVVWG